MSQSLSPSESGSPASGIQSAYFSSEPQKSPNKAPSRRASTTRKRKRTSDDAKYVDDKDEEESEDAYDSDVLDDDEAFGKMKKKAKGKKSPTKKTPSPKKKRKINKEDEDEASLDLEEGQTVVGAIVQAPKTGRVPPGQVSQNTLDFLGHLADPKYNDREWFKLHEPVYRLAEQEWKDFVEAFTDVLIEVDSEVPPLPPKDVIHRIYRDIRFSNDKTPYKKGFSASFSRSGRKGIFAGYHIAVKPNNESIIAAGSWCPGRNELATIRSNIQRSSTRLRNVISDPEFVKYFGKAKPHPKGERQSIFGMDDELKTAPKGVDKEHPDIDLLKCRSFAVVHRFTDSEVLDPNFKNRLGDVAKVMRPLVRCLNDMMTVLGSGDAESSDDDE